MPLMSLRGVPTMSGRRSNLYFGNKLFRGNDKLLHALSTVTLASVYATKPVSLSYKLLFLFSFFNFLFSFRLSCAFLSFSLLPLSFLPLSPIHNLHSFNNTDTLPRSVHNNLSARDN